ncbi:MAG: hypothetical protein IKT72_06780 [Clostridia bacterium]|nr:hypothetical protein [Clostridia bacterium]
MKTKIAPAVAHLDLWDLKSALSTLELNGVDLLHVDVSDGSFAPRISGGAELCDALRAHSNLPLDLHLNVLSPERLLANLTIKKGDQVSVRADGTAQLYRVLCEIKKSGGRAFLSLGLLTPLTALTEALPYIDGVHLSLADPLYPTSRMPSGAIDKIVRIRSLLNESGHGSTELEVEGFMSFENAAKMKKAGASIFVGDAFGIFHRDQTLAGGIVRLRNAVLD